MFVDHSLYGTEVRVPTDDSSWPLAALDLDLSEQHPRSRLFTFGTLDRLKLPDQPRAAATPGMPLLTLVAKNNNNTSSELIFEIPHHNHNNISPY